ncbi:MAG TPA: ShlB/FhaC/HecB family hemolysin secretion/activation protein [Gammaproteobacteria bacterium]|nr:ShlB/FhaC/HecB family hemolysin secretion/activation protein [Gammaproteobacteria bacterium]
MKRMLPFKFASVVVAACLLDGRAIADVLPGAAMPEQVGRSLRQQQIARQPAATPATLQNQDQGSAAPLSPEVQKLKFKLIKIELEGNKLFTTPQLQPLYQPSIGKEITVAELFKLVENITNYYRNNGYVISRAILPPQHVKGGIVKVQIIEGYLDQVSVIGTPRGSRCLIQDYGKQIAKQQPLAIERMEKYLMLANEVPGTQVKAVLSPSKKKSGAADLNLATTTKLFNGYVSYDNYGTRYIGPQQMTGSIGLNSAINSGDSTNLTFTKTAKGGELTYVDLNYGAAFNDEGVRYLVGGTRVHTHPLFVLRSSQIDGLNDNYYSMLVIPAIRSRSRSLNYTVGFNYLDSNTTALDQPLYQDHLRNLDLGILYSFADRWYGSNSIGGNFRQGLPILGYSSDYNPDTATTSRPGGRGDYTKASVQLSRLQAIKGPVSLLGVLRGQWAFNPLLSSEQFSFGGSVMGRGYDSAELIGDRGLAGSLELRYDKAVFRFFVQTLQFYTFYDVGKIWNLKTSSSTPFALSAASTGLGVRFTMTKSISGNLMWTQPITKEVAAEEFINQGKRPRVFFSVVANLD